MSSANWRDKSAYFAIDIDSEDDLLNDAQPNEDEDEEVTAAVPFDENPFYVGSEEEFEDAAAAAAAPPRKKSRPESAGQGKNWVAVLNNPEGEPKTVFDQIIKDQPDITYLVGQLERGENGTPHLQLYIQFGRRMRMTQLKKGALVRAHFEIARGSAAANKTYCTKEETRVAGPWEWGEIKHQGQRSDLAEFAAASLDPAKKPLEIAREHPVAFMKFARGFTALRSLLPAPPRTPPKVHLMLGPTGTGKTYLATTEYTQDPDEVYIKPVGSSLWFDNYHGQKVFVWDEIVHGEFKIAFMLRFLDRYALSIEIKGGHVWLEAEDIILTSNQYPDEWCDWRRDREDKTGSNKWTDAHFAAFARRVHSVHLFYSAPDGPVVSSLKRTDPESSSALDEWFYAKCTSAAWKGCVPTKVALP